MDIEYIKFRIAKLICFFRGHDWYIVDYFIGLENNKNWNIIECDRCGKVEIE